MLGMDRTSRVFSCTAPVKTAKPY